MPQFRKKVKPWHGIDPALPLGEQLKILEIKLKDNKKKSNISFLPTKVGYDLSLPFQLSPNEIATITCLWCKEAVKPTGKFQLLNILLLLALPKTTPQKVLTILNLPKNTIMLAIDFLNGVD